MPIRWALPIESLSLQTDPSGRKTLKQIVAPAQAGARLDQFLAQALGWSRARLQKLLKAGQVTVNGAPKAASYKVRAAEAVTVQVPQPSPSPLAPEPLALEIIYEDRDLLVINKPPGQVVHPGAGHRGGTLLNALLHHCPELQEIGEVSRPGLVHRLDKDTSGLLVVAKTALAHQSLVGQFAARETQKKYLALVWGRLPEAEGRIDKDIGRHPSQRHKMTAQPRRGKAAVTRWQVRRQFPGPLTLVELSPETGRTHQLRVHLTSLGHPVLGDGTYGGGVSRLAGAPKLKGLKPLVHRQLLHAWKLSVTHPRTGEKMTWEAPLPEDLQAVVEKLSNLG